MKERQPVIVKTASFTLDPAAVKSGTRITTRGAAGAVTMTLPQFQTGNPSWDGYWVELHGGADQSITVAATANKAICFNNLTATSLAASTAGQKIGAVIRAVWDFSAGKWHLIGVSVGHTFTVA